MYVVCVQQEEVVWEEHECTRAASVAVDLLADVRLAMDLLLAALRLDPRNIPHISA